MQLPTIPPWRTLKTRAAYLVSGLIAVAGAVLSYGALAEIGNAAVREVPGLFGMEPPWAGRIWAATVDGFILLGFLKVGDGVPWQVVLAVVHIVAGLGASLAFQWFHAQGKVDPLAVAITPPAAVFLSLDTWALPKLLAHLQARKEEAGERIGSPPPAPTPREMERRPPATVAPRRSTPGVKLSQPDMMALDRAKKDPVKVERVLVRRGIPRELVAARPERWPLPSDNGDGS
jgi:hypothetical protein